MFKKLTLILSLVVIPTLSYSSEYLIVGSEQFRARGGSSSDFNLYNTGNYVSALGGIGYAVAPIRLPAGSTVEHLSCHMYDNSSVHNVSVRLKRSAHTDSQISAVITTMATAASSGAPGLTREFDSTISTPVIEDWTSTWFSQTMYSYYLEWVTGEACSSSCRVYACSIQYEPPS